MDQTSVEQKNTGTTINEIISKYYNKEDNKHKRDSNFHGDDHIKVVVMITYKAQTFYNKYAKDVKLNTFLKPNEQHLTLIAAALHDSGRVDEEVDRDEFSSALLCLSYLLENNLCDVKTAIKLAICVAGKDLKEGEDNTQVSLLINFLQRDFSSKKELDDFIDQTYPNKTDSRIDILGLKAAKLKKLLNSDAMIQAAKGYKKNKKEIDNFVQNDLEKNITSLSINTADTIDIVRCGPQFDEQYAIYAKIFQDNAEALEEFRNLQKKWEEKRININYNNDGSGHFNQRATDYIEKKEYDLDFNKFCEEYSLRVTMLLQKRVVSSQDQSSKTFKYSVIASVSVLGAFSSVIGFYAYHLLTHAVFMSPVLGICVAVGLALGVIIFKLAETISNYKDTNPKEKFGKRISETIRLTFSCRDNTQQTVP